jgi:hypothetical protein
MANATNSSKNASSTGNYTLNITGLTPNWNLGMIA